MLAKLLCRVDSELVEVARRDTRSVLRFRDFDGMSTLDFTEIIKEIQTLCPTVFSFLSQMILLSNSPEKKTVPLALLYGVIMFNRCKEMSRLQRVNTVLLSEGDASQEVQTWSLMVCYLEHLICSVCENTHNSFSLKG